jgi:hypothetical protein
MNYETGGSATGWKIGSAGHRRAMPTLLDIFPDARELLALATRGAPTIFGWPSQYVRPRIDRQPTLWTW